MPFSRVLAQQAAVDALERALRRGRVHHAYRFEGPQGVGKELAAFALAQALVCEGGDPLGCGQCRACVRAVSLNPEEPMVPLHPDVLLVARGLYPPALLGTTHPEVSSIGIEQIRRIVLSRAGYPPHEGRAVVCIVRDADELSLQAANALLKSIEEPGDRMHYVLLTSRPDRLPDTVRSRTLAVRFGPLPDSVVADLLEQHGAPRSVAPFAQGSMSLGLQLADPTRMQQREAFVHTLLQALDAEDLASALEALETKSLARDKLREKLDYLAYAVAARAKESLGTDVEEAERCSRRFSIVLEAVRELDRFVQPALVLEALVTRLRRAV